MKKTSAGLQKPLAWRVFDEQARQKENERRVELEKKADREEKRQERREKDYKEDRKTAQDKVSKITGEILTAKRDTNTTHFALVATPVAAAVAVNVYMYQNGDPFSSIGRFITVVGLTAYTIKMNVKYLPRNAEFRKMLDKTHDIEEKLENKEINKPDQIPSFRNLREAARLDLYQENKDKGFLNKLFRKHATDWAIGIISTTAIVSSSLGYFYNYMTGSDNKTEISSHSDVTKPPKDLRPR